MTLIGAGRSLSFVVEGAAQTKGSAKAFVPYKWAEEAVHRARATGKRIGPRAVITNDNPAAEAWQKAITEAARKSRRGGPLVAGELMAGAVVVDLAFYLPRPIKIRGGLVSHTTRPDVDKLARCALDGLTGVVYADDGQVVGIRITKQYAAAEDNRPRVEVSITETTVADPTAPPLFT